MACDLNIVTSWRQVGDLLGLEHFAQYGTFLNVENGLMNRVEAAYPACGPTIRSRSRSRTSMNSALPLGEPWSANDGAAFRAKQLNIDDSSFTDFQGAVRIDGCRLASNPSENAEQAVMGEVESVPVDAWTKRFRERNGRAPTALHIGNIANAAYLNARMLNEAGIDCDVLCYEYYHIMACPEWETAIFDPNGIDPDRPLWSKVNLHGYERPRWFAQGSLDTCINYLTARRTGNGHADELWRRLEREQEKPGVQQSWDDWTANLNCASARIEDRINDLVTAFCTDFPLRSDRLGADELREALSLPGEHFARLGQYFARLQRLCSLYDVVIGYSTDGILPLAVGKHPYVAYEHGTIRALPFEDSTVGRLCALTYSRADITFITNCDTVIAAEELKLSDYRFVPHPINEHVVASPEPCSLRQQLCQNLQADFLVFHPARQHWEPQRHPSWEKGNDIFLKGFAHFVKTVRPRAAAILVNWGKSVAQSRALIEHLGIAERVIWIVPQNAAGMAAYIRASDVLADQFFLGAWGSTMPRALYLGTPVMIYLNESIHRWCIPEMPPIVNAETSDAVYYGLCRLLDAKFRSTLGAAGTVWFHKYHSNKVITECFSRAIRDVLIPAQERRLHDAVREVRDLAPIWRQIRDRQFKLEQVSDAFGLAQREIATRVHEMEERLLEFRNDLQQIKEQLSAVREIASGLTTLIPNIQRANQVAQLLLRRPYRALRFVYRLLRKRPA
jgi:hypothetical protein